jgi:gliding motility-associated-like protein
LNKTFLHILCFLLLGIASKAQVNLVPNGSFEDIDSCYGDPSAIGFDVFQWSGCTGWSCPTKASSDLWCENPVWGMNTPPFIPGFGFQYPMDGNNMAGIFVYEPGSYPNYREYIQCQLLQPLEPNKVYEIIFYINSAGADNFTSSVGAYFSPTQVSQSGSWNVLPYQPQVENDPNNYITDTLGWTKISGTFTAQGGEQYMVIGTFADSSSIRLTVTDSMLAGGVYFFVDGISVHEVASDVVIPNVFTPNGDGVNDLFIPAITNVGDWTLEIFNRWGVKVGSLNVTSRQWDGTTTSGKPCSDGVYYYVLTGKRQEGTEYLHKGFVHLLR